jgi:hypothetical protein
MADSSTPLDQVVAGSGAAARINELFDAASSAMVFARRAATCTGLTWGYYGGRWSGLSVANGTVALTASATNYVVVALATGVVSVSTATTNWNDTTNYARAYEIVAGGASVSSYEDHRAGSGGTINAAQTTTSVLGKHAIYVSAAAMQPSVTGGCASLTALASASAANQPDIVTLDFDPTTQSSRSSASPCPRAGTKARSRRRSSGATPPRAATSASCSGAAGRGVSDGDSDRHGVRHGRGVADTGGTTNVLYQR